MRLHSKRLVLGWLAPAFWLLSAAACDGEPDPVGSGASTGTAGAGGAGDTPQGISTPRVTDAAGTVCMDIKLGGTAEIRVGPPSSPFDTRMVTSSGPAADCDDDCDGTSECGGISLWSKVFGDAAYQRAWSAAIDGAGNVVIAGSFEGTVDFGGGPLASAGAYDVFVAKFDANGNHLWSKVFGDAGQAVAYSAAIDGAGNVVIAGSFEGTVDFGGGPLASAGAYDVFVAKLDANGNHLWSKVFGDAGQAVAYSAAIDGAGNVVIAGSFEGTVDFGGGPLASAGVEDIFVAKLDANGNHLWSKVFGDAAHAYSAAIDGAGNVVIAGTFQGTVDFGGGPLIDAGAYKVFVAKLDPDGNHLWSKVFGDAGPAVAYSAALDVAGNVVIAGTVQGTVDFGGGPLASAGETDIFVAKLDPNGDHLWSKVFGAAAYQWAYSAALDVAGNVLLTGIFDGTVDLGGGPLASAGAYDVFVAKLDPDGNHLWSRRLGAAGDQWANSAAVDGAGNVVIAGWFQGTVSFGNEPLTGAGMDDIFVAKLTP